MGADNFFSIQEFLKEYLKRSKELYHSRLIVLTLAEMIDSHFNQISVGNQVDLRLKLAQAEAFRSIATQLELTHPAGFLAYKIEELFGKYSIGDKMLLG